MPENKRKTRLFAFSSIVCRQAGPLDRTLRVRRISPPSSLGRLENQTVTCAFPPAQEQNPPRRMDAIYEFMT